jgi:hypothetical protein
MPSSSDARIDELCSRIKVLCRGPFTPTPEAELRRLARVLRAAIKQHVEAARSSLTTKQAAIAERDPEGR